MNHMFTFSSRVRTIMLPGLAVLLALGLGMIAPAFVNAQTGVAPVTVPAGGFAIDGNLLARVPVTSPFSNANGDFLPNDGAPGTGGYVFTSAGVPLDTTKAFHVTDGYDAADASVFTGGSKFNGNPNNWVWKTGKPTAKDDINHVLFFFANDAAGNLWFVGSGDRKNTNGNTYLDFELLQNPLYKNANYTFTSLGPDGGRTLGDLAITVIYTNGGSNPQLVIHKWSSVGSGFNWVQVTPPAGTAYLATNKDSVVVVPYGAFGANTYQKSAFTEVACNLSDLIPGMVNCMDIKTVISKSKASQSVNAELKDFINPVQVSIESAPEISVNSDTICYGESATLTVTVLSGAGPFTYLWSTGDTTQSITVSPDTTTQYTVVVTGGSGCPSEPATATVTVLPLPEVNITGDDTICFGDTTTLTANVISGTGPFTYLWSTGDTTQSIIVAPDTTTQYSVVATASTGCESEPDTMTVVVVPLPEISITGPDSICVGDTATLTANVLSGTGPFIYLWSTGDTTQSVEVAPDTTTQYSVMVTAGSGCISEPAFFTLNIMPLPLVNITGQDTICIGDSTTLTATVVTGSGPFTYLWSTGDTTQSIIVAPVAATLYSVVVTSGTGCESEPATVTVEVLSLPVCSITGPDTLCPAGTGVFTAPDSLAAYAWTVTGNGTIQGNANEQTVTVQGNGGCDSTFTVNLVVTNAGGCSSTCSMSVFLTDTIAPVITDVPGPANYQCAGQVPVAGADTVTVTDDCSGVVLVITDSVTSQTCYDQFTLLRTWLATDLCGNTATASQVITVMDTIAPVLTGVPADTGVCCGDSIPLPPVVTANDGCDGAMPVTMTEVVTDSIGPNMFILTRTWTAVDSCNNLVTDSQVITVNDTLFPPAQYPFGIGSPGNVIIRFTVGPNPFYETTNVQFAISEDAPATVELYNYMGVKVKTLYNGHVATGSTVTIRLSANDNMKAGVYLLVLKTTHGTQVKHVVLTR